MVTRNHLFCALLFGFAVMCLCFASYSIFVYYEYPILRSIVPSQISASTFATSVNCALPEISRSRGQKSGLDEGLGVSRTIWFSTFLLIMVPIRQSDRKSRQLIRDTWFEGFRNSQDVALRFAVGHVAMKPITYTEENKTFGDIVLLGIKEHSNTLTNKTLAIINWAHHHVRFSYFMKCDDDTYVFVQNMINELRKRPTTTKLYQGRFMIDHPPIRGHAKWADNEWDLGPNYIPFALGGGYVISHDLVATLNEVSQRLKWHPNEDTAVGAWLSAFDHERRDDRRFCLQWRNKEASFCERPILVYIFHEYRYEEVRRYFNHFHEQVINKTNNVTLLTI